MTGLNSSTLVYGVLDLIKRELRKNVGGSSAGGGPLDGTPSVILERDHPEDEDQLTGALMLYPSGYQSHVYLILGMPDEDIEIALAKNHYVEGDIVPSKGEGLDEWEMLSFEEQQEILNPDMDDEDELGSDHEEDSYFGEYILEPVLPEAIKDSSHPDFEFYAKWRLSKVDVTVSDPQGELVAHNLIHLVYDHKSMLQTTLAQDLLTETYSEI